MANIIGEIWVCQSCMLVHANGECGELEDGEPEPLSLVDDRYLAMGTQEHSDTCPGETEEGCDCAEHGFCTTRCEGCGSELYGERYSLVVFDG